MGKNFVNVPVTALRVGDRLYDRTWVCDGTVKASISDGEKPIGFHVLWHKFDPKIEKDNPDVPDNIFIAHNKTVYQLYYDGYDPTDLIHRFGGICPQPSLVTDEGGGLHLRQWIATFPTTAPYVDLSELIQILNSWYDDVIVDTMGGRTQIIIWE